MISCIVIDDEKRALDTFQKIAERYFSDKLKVVALASSVREGYLAIEECSPNIVFLDIEMPGENGFKLFNYFTEVKFGVVFLTAYKNYAIDAIRYSAFDYLLKPLDVDDLARVINRFEKKQNTVQQTERVKNLLQNLDSGAEASMRVALPTFTGFRLVQIDNIIFCQASENYTLIHTLDRETILVSRTLKVMEDILPETHFFRIHKSFIINLSHVKEYIRNNGQHQVQLENGVTLEVATRRQEEFIRMLTGKSI